MHAAMVVYSAYALEVWAQTAVITFTLTNISLTYIGNGTIIYYDCISEEQKVHVFLILYSGHIAATMA